MIDGTLMRFEERAILQLRSIYRKYGYIPYKMSKFEEYELYIRNKEFLVSDRVITFNDTTGKLMALKPDVTLSIIKNCEDTPGVKQKVFYNENVYRVSESTHRFKEIMQTGLECIGDLDLYDVYEVITLAAESLANISDSFCLDVSNLDIVYSVVSGVCPDVEFIRMTMGFISEKNTHDLKKLCIQYSVNDKDAERLASLVSLFGKRGEVIAKLKEICGGEKIRQLETLSEMLDGSEYGDRINFDFSVVNDMNYYNGYVFKGFIDGICCGVLAGGQYDNMMKKMDRKSGAIGFAIYLDRLDELENEVRNFDVDALVIYDGECTAAEVQRAVDGIVKSGKTASAQRGIPEKLRFREIVDLRKGGREKC